MSNKDTFSIQKYNKLAESSGSEIKIIGLSGKGSPIKVLKKGSGKIRILFTARIHGNEPATSEAMLRFFSENTFDGFEMHGVFLCNPDGAALYEELWNKNSLPDWKNSFSDARLNANGIDINRDWLDLSQAETKALQKYIMDVQPHFAADFHEYYWSDKGYPPKEPSDDEDGFMATMSDAAFFGVDKWVEDVSEKIMHYLTLKLDDDFGWKIKLRHFMGSKENSYTSPTFLGVYLALRGIPKLLVETWGVGCSTLYLDKRILFHKNAMGYILEWISKNEPLILSGKASPLSVKYNIAAGEQEKLTEFIKILDLHGVKYETGNNAVTVNSTSLEIGFVKTIYHIIFEKDTTTNETT
jgi:hypothetical protein